MGECSAYDVSVASHSLSRYPDSSLNLFSFIPIPSQWPEEVKQTLHWALGHASISLIIGVSMVLILIILSIIQLARKTFSSPTERYWVWSIRSTRFFMVLISYIISLLAAVGLNYVYDMHENLMDPVIGFEQVVSEKYRLTVKLATTINHTAEKFSIVIPEPYLIVFQYVKDIGGWHESLETVEQYGLIMSDYAHFILAIGFGLIICICVFSSVLALSKHRCLPYCTVFLIFITTFLIWIMASITGVLSLILARECNNGLDKLTDEYLINNTDFTPCVRASINHYFFCAPWNSTVSIAENCDPFPQMMNFTNYLISVIAPLGPAFQPILQNLLEVNQTIIQLDSCEDTRAVYSISKQNMCWDVNNAAMQVTLLYFIQAPVLIILFVYILFAWHRFNIKELPYVSALARAAPLPVASIEPTTATEELALFGSEMIYSEESSLIDYPTSALTTTTTTTTTYQQPEDESTPLLFSPVAPPPRKQFSLDFNISCCGVVGDIDTASLKKIVARNIRTIVITSLTFLTVFLMIFVWLGMLHHDFVVHSRTC